jgi:hypothetical protein
VEDWKSWSRGVLAWRTFARVHPFTDVMQGSAECPGLVRALLASVGVLGTVLLTALFFEAAGLPADSRPECAAIPGHVLWTGLLSAELKSGVIALLRGLLRKRPRPRAQEAQVRRCWRIREAAAGVLGAAYLLFCTFYVLAFGLVAPSKCATRRPFGCSDASMRAVWVAAYRNAPLPPCPLFVKWLLRIGFVSVKT